MKFASPQRIVAILFLLLLGLLGAIVLALACGSEPLHWTQVFTDGISVDRDIFFLSRLPRVWLGAVVGMALSSAGASFQGLLKNPLADPFILGVSSGAALGSILALACGMVFPWISLVAFASALAATFLVYSIASYRKNFLPETLLLTGVIFNAFAFAFILIVNALVTLEQSHQILYFLIGSLEAIPYRDLWVVSALVVTGLVVLSTEGRALNLLSESRDTAFALGLSPKKHQLKIFFGASLMVGAVVSVSGLIGFVGLFIPHIARMLLGPDHRLLIPSSALLGASTLLLCDSLARTVGFHLNLSSQLPVGSITALLGAPLFIILLRRLH